MMKESETLRESNRFMTLGWRWIIAAHVVESALIVKQLIKQRRLA